MRAILACLTLGAALLSMADEADAQTTELDRSLEQLVTDYTRLYTRETFAEWRALFLPTFTSTSTTADGGTSVRSLEAFLAAQERGFRESQRMGERLERVRIDRRGRIAMVAADFEYWNNDTTRRGTLVLAAVHVREGWRFQSLVFSYPD
ncbi:MAG: nuclear transport factor 2 family protein [Gemmatimonadetes bacterium]|nr:nuclear transport factor 2 family protein [Gemmatimonadota bacterium]